MSSKPKKFLSNLKLNISYATLLRFLKVQGFKVFSVTKKPLIGNKTKKLRRR